MLVKRIIPCLDVANGRVVKGVQFKNTKDVGDPVEIARRYNTDGADEISFLDIMATEDNKSVMLDLIGRIARELFIPFSVGGGIKTIEDVRKILRAGAEKVSVGSAAVQDPTLIKKASAEFGSQAIVLSIDAKRNNKMPWGYEVYVNGGRKPTGLDALTFAKRMTRLGAGEVLLNVIDADGTRQGYDIAITRLFSETLSTPLIASGGAGTPDDILKVLTEGKADAALAASIFHTGDYSIGDVKAYLARNGVAVREVTQ